MIKGYKATDYFIIECQNCGSIIQRLDFYGIDSVGIQLRAKCKSCEKEIIFKMKTYPPLGPIEMTDKYNKRAYKLFDGRKLKKHLREIGHPTQIYKKRNKRA